MSRYGRYDFGEDPVVKMYSVSNPRIDDNNDDVNVDSLVEDIMKNLADPTIGHSLNKLFNDAKL